MRPDFFGQVPDQAYGATPVVDKDVFHSLGGGGWRFNCAIEPEA